jgi:hypothetical protein
MNIQGSACVRFVWNVGAFQNTRRRLIACSNLTFTSVITPCYFHKCMLQIVTRVQRIMAALTGL